MPADRLTDGSREQVRRDYGRYMDDVPPYLRPSVAALRRFGKVRIKGKTTLWEVSLAEGLWHAQDAETADA